MVEVRVFRFLYFSMISPGIMTVAAVERGISGRNFAELTDPMGVISGQEHSPA